LVAKRIRKRAPTQLIYRWEHPQTEHGPFYHDCADPPGYRIAALVDMPSSDNDIPNYHDLLACGMTAKQWANVKRRFRVEDYAKLYNAGFKLRKLRTSTDQIQFGRTQVGFIRETAKVVGEC
jgi:hypothetical protein